MRIGVIQASSQATKNQIIYDAVLKYAPKKSEVINFGCTMEENEKYSYIEISILVGILLASRTVDFVVTGCSSGQGMMLACNSMPDVICGSRVIIMTEANSSVKSKVLKLLPKLKTEETDSLCVA